MRRRPKIGLVAQSRGAWCHRVRADRRVSRKGLPQRAERNCGVLGPKAQHLLSEVDDVAVDEVGAYPSFSFTWCRLLKSRSDTVCAALTSNPSSRPSCQRRCQENSSLDSVWGLVHRSAISRPLNLGTSFLGSLGAGPRQHTPTQAPWPFWLAAAVCCTEVPTKPGAGCAIKMAGPDQFPANGRADGFRSRRLKLKTNA